MHFNSMHFHDNAPAINQKKTLIANKICVRQFAIHWWTLQILMLR